MAGMTRRNLGEQDGDETVVFESNQIEAEPHVRHPDLKE
jgi:hypothetical protein